MSGELGIPDVDRGPLWWCAFAFGSAMMAVAVAGLAAQVDLVAFVRWLLAGLVVHDAVAVPMVAVAGTLLARRIRDGGVRDAVTWGLWVVALVVITWWPSLAGAGTNTSNPSILPRPYVRNLGIVTVLLALVVAVRAAGARWGSKRDTARP